MCIFWKDRQKITDINDSDINQAGRDNNIVVINQGIQYSDLRQIVTDIVRSEMFQLSSQARETIKELAIQYEKKLSEKLVDIHEDDSIKQFGRPDIQFVLRDSLKQYVKDANDENLEDQIDMLIDRLHVDNENVMKSIIEEAIITLPKLSKSAVALLAAMRLRDLTMEGDSLAVFAHFSGTQKIYKYIQDIKPIEVAYLRQLNCCNSFSDLKQYNLLENIIFGQYDLLFRHYGKIEDFDNIVKENTFLSIENYKNKYALFKYKDRELMSCFPNTTILQTELEKINETDKIQPLLDFFSKCPLFTSEEIRNLMIDIAPDFKYAFETLNRKDVQSLKITPLGAYIGQKYIIKQLGVSCPEIYESFEL